MANFVRFADIAVIASEIYSAHIKSADHVRDLLIIKMKDGSTLQTFCEDIIHDGSDDDVIKLVVESINSTIQLSLI